MAAKTARLEMRLSVEHKDLLERAAAVRGQPLSSFALSLLVDQAQAILEKQSSTVLSRRDQKRFLTIIESDEEPVPALKAAARKATRGRRG